MPTIGNLYRFTGNLYDVPSSHCCKRLYKLDNDIIMYLDTLKAVDVLYTYIWLKVLYKDTPCYMYWGEALQTGIKLIPV